MALSFNIRHLEQRDLHLEGELSAEELDLAGVDEMVELAEPLQYDLTVERMGDSVLVQGTLEAKLNCHCVRCLKPFEDQLELNHWARSLPLEGEESVQITNDCVDLTPYVREDILLAFPQHPLCEPECHGLPDAGKSLHEAASVGEQANDSSSTWSELNKLKF